MVVERRGINYYFLTIYYEWVKFNFKLNVLTNYRFFRFPRIQDFLNLKQIKQSNMIRNRKKILTESKTIQP
jgi:hypothetical protein